MIRDVRLALLGPALIVLAACGGDPGEPGPEQTQVPQELAQDSPAAPGDQGESLGTPMAERVATVGLLNKRNNVSRDFELSPGGAVRAGDVVIRLSACEKTPPWELPQEEAGFVQVFVRDNAQDTWNKVFSGWLFRNSPSLNVVEHPVYDVWVKECAMSFPGEED